MTAPKKIKPTLVSKKTPIQPLAPPAPAFAIVGIGASAGGLAAFEAFLSGMPAETDPGMAFVFVQHLAPDYKSMLTELVKRYTRMDVFEVADGMTVQPNCAYIIPPNHDMALLNGSLQLFTPTAPRGQRLPIDFFFRSLAQDQHERAICIVLSGTGSDGTLGLRAIKGAGGMAMTQSIESAAYDGMPRSAIATGMVDYVLPPAEMPAQLIRYVARAIFKQPQSAATPRLNQDILKKIAILLRAQTGHDFAQYKQNTIARRVERRMAVQMIDHLENYLQYLQKTPAEVDALFHDLLIGVTSFFRDPGVFSALKEQVIAKLLINRPANEAIRVWVAGCSTGEEAYSIAILLQEQMEISKQSFQVQIFATDIDNRAIDQARFGLYPASIAADLTPERLARFFIKEPNGSTYRIQKNIRDMLIFSEQNLIKDPPFSKLDLISCRNLLIYLGPDLQARLMPLFHYGLKPNGFLLLGTSESIGEHFDLFTALDRKAKLYQRKEDTSLAEQRARIATMMPSNDTISSLQPTGKPLHDKLKLRELTEQTLLQHYATAAVLINEQGQILYLQGETGHYLALAPGEADLNILKMARDGLHHELFSALRKSIAMQDVVCSPNLLVKTDGDFSPVNLTVRPVHLKATNAENISPETNLYLVILEESTAQQTQPDQPASASNEFEERILALKRELRIKDEYLQATTEELATTNEELKSSNEEMQSVNEELQSSNEELETSKEELQSINEELSTINSELQQKVNDLSHANADMNNLLAGTGLATIFVDQKLLIQRFTPSVTKIINLISSDVGRPVGHIVTNLMNYDQLVDDAQSVLDSLVPKELEVRTQKGDWYLLHLRPYRTLENVIDGVVITFTEINDMKKAQVAQQEIERLRQLARIVHNSYDPIIVHSLDGRILSWNPAAAKAYGWSESEALTISTRERIPETQRKLELGKIQQLSTAEKLEPYRTQRLTKSGQTIEIWLIATALLNPTGDVYAITTTERIIPAQGE